MSLRNHTTRRMEIRLCFGVNASNLRGATDEQLKLNSPRQQEQGEQVEDGAHYAAVMGFIPRLEADICGEVRENLREGAIYPSGGQRNKGRGEQ